MSHQWIMFAKLLYLIIVPFHYNSLIIENDIEIFVCIDDIPLLKVNCLYVTKYTDENLFYCSACHWSRSTDVLPVTLRYMHPSGCRSARPRTSWPTAELLEIVIFDQNISVCRTDHSTNRV